MKIDTTNTKSINYAKSFPGKLEEVHQGRIVLKDTAVYRSTKENIDVACTVCGHEWSARPNNLIDKQSGCPECKRLAFVARAGVIRQPRASKAEKELAKCCHKAGMSLDAIGDLLNRSKHTIHRWIDSGVAERHRQRNKERHAIQKASGHQQKVLAAYRQTEHGKANASKSDHKRRSLKYHAIDDVLVDGVWHSYDCYQYIDTPEDREFWSFPGANEDVAKRKIQQDKLAVISGEPYSLEHLVPLNRGGIHHPDNFANRALALNKQKKDNILSKDVELFCRRLFA